MDIPEFNNNDDIIYNTKFPSTEESRRGILSFWKITGELGFSYGAFSEREDDLVLLITVN